MLLLPLLVAIPIAIVGFHDDAWEKAQMARSKRQSAAWGLIGMVLFWPVVQEASAAVIEEVVVTAQKRSESTQDVPIAIAAYGERRLEDAGFDQISDLTLTTPSMQVSNFGPIAYVTMRGIGSENTTAGGDPGVAMHLDGVYMGRPIASMFTAFDAERVEILRGPQGTLYGRNATGGSINLVTRKPGSEFEGEMDVTYGDYDWMRFRGAVNLPISDRVSARLVAFKEERDGYTDNAHPDGNDANDLDNYGFRGHLNFDVSDRASLLLSASYVKVDGAGSKSELREDFPGSTTGQHLAGPPGFLGASGGPASGIPAGWDYFLNGALAVNDLDHLEESKNLRESSDDEFLLLSATFEMDFDGFTIKSISGYNETEFASLQDADQSPVDLAGSSFSEQAEQFSQELQILSNGTGPLQWIGGLYYFKQDATRRSFFFRGRFDAIARTFGVPSAFDVGGDVESESIAGFGQLTYSLTDRLNLTVGARHTKDEKKGTNTGYTFTNGYTGPLGDDWNESTYRLAADWFASDDVLLYASYATGYKSGGVNQVTNPLADNPIYDPEFVDAFEVGLKSTLLNGSLQLNLSAYHNKYEDLQFQVFGAVGPQALNAEGAKVQGIEAELLAALSDTLTIDASVGLTDSEFDEQFISGVQLEGNQVQRTPDVTYSLGIANEWELGNAGALRVRLEYAYTDEIYYTAFNRNARFAEAGGSDLADDYSNLNLRMFWYSADDRWTVELSATNLTDEEQEGNVFRGIGFLDVAGGGGPEQVTYNPPRQIALRMGFRF